MKHLMLLALFFLFRHSSYSQAGKPDLSFGGKGWIREEFIKVNSEDDAALQVLIQKNDSYIVAIGEWNGRIKALVRFHPDGLLDKGFGKEGYLYFIDISVSRVALQKDGKIIVAGSNNNDPSGFILVRFNTDGSPDSSFKGLPTAGTGSVIMAVVVQSDDKILVSSRNDTTFVSRYNSDGSPDLSLGMDGTITFDINNGLVNVDFLDVQKDGKIVLAGTFFTRRSCPRCGPREGTYQPALVRLNKYGSFDHDFGEDGKIITEGGVPSMQKDDKMILARQEGGGVMLARYNKDGSPDPGFNSGGANLAEFENGFFPSSVAVQNNGKIVVAGTTGGNNPESGKDFALVRYNKNGNLDESFGGDGKLTTDFGFNDVALSVAMHNNGEIIVAGLTTGTTNWDFAIAGYNKNGSLDHSFDQDGKMTGYFPFSSGSLNSIAVQSDGKLVVGGGSRDSIHRFVFFLSRYNPDGTTDNTFGDDGKQTTDFGATDALLTSISIQKDGKILAAGRLIISAYPDADKSSFAIARYNTDGTPDNTFSGDGLQVTSFTGFSMADAYSVVVQEDGKILVAGTATDAEYNRSIAFARYNADGSPDESFGNEGLVTYKFAAENYSVNLVIIQPDKKILVAGTVESGNQDFLLARFNQDGTPDEAFGTGGKQTTDFNGQQDVARSMAIQNDGKIVLAGTMYKSDTDYDFAMARYNSDGSLDNTFSEDGKVTTDFGYNDGAHSVNIQADGKIIAAGSSFNYTGTEGNDMAIARYNADGTIDTEFGAGGKLSNDFGGYDRADAAVIYNNRLYTTGNDLVASYYLTGLGNLAAEASKSIKDQFINNGRQAPKVTDDKPGFNLSLRPNPVHHTLEIQPRGLEPDKPTSVLIISAGGVMVKSVQLYATTNIIKIDLSAVKPGIYAVTLINGNKIFTKQFMKL